MRRCTSANENSERCDVMGRERDGQHEGRHEHDNGYAVITWANPPAGAMNEDEREAFWREHSPEDARIADDFTPLLRAKARERDLSWETLPIGNEARAHILLEVRQLVERVEKLGGAVIC